MANKAKNLQEVSSHLRPREEVICSVEGQQEVERMGASGVRKGVLVATDQRLVFFSKKMSGYELESYPYENISSFEHGKNFSGANITFYATGNKVHVKWIKDADLALVVEEVRSRMGKKSASPSEAIPSGLSEPDVFAQIARLKELHEVGVLTDEEFSTKKAELLSRI